MPFRPAKTPAPVTRASRRRALALRTAGFASLAIALAAAPSARANTEKDVLTTATALDDTAGYGDNTLPGTTSDLTFTNSNYTSTSFTLNSTALSIGTLNDLDATQALAISASKSITLNGGGNSVSGTAGDLLYVATGGSLALSGTGGLVLAASGNFDIAGTASISSVTSGAFAITKTGAGTLTLSGANTYSGGTAINAGIVNIGNANALGTTGTISFGGGTLQYGSGITTDLSNRFTSNAGQAYSIDTVANNATFATAFGGAAANGNTLTKSGAGVLTLSGANTYTGGTTVNAGAIYLGNATGAGTGTITLAGTSSLLYNNVNFNNPLNVTGTNTIVNQGDNADGSHTGAITGSGTLSIASVTVGGTTYNPVSSFKYNGDLSGFTGTFVDGTNTNVIFQGAANNGFNAKWVVNGSVFVGSNAGTGGIFQMGELSGSTGVLYGNYQSGTPTVYQVGALNTNSTYAGKISDNNGGKAAITKVGSGTLTLSGQVNTSGADTINAGTLQFAKTQSLFNGGTPTTGNFIVNSGATAAFNVGGTGEFTAASIATIAALGTSTGGFRNGSTLALDTTNAGGSFTYGTAITNTNSNANAVGLTKLGTGALSLTAASTYTGATTIAAGTLSLTGALGNTAVTVNSGATLTGSGNNSTTGVIGGTVTALGGSFLTLGSASSGTALRSTGAISLGNTGTYSAANYTTLNFTLASGGNVEALNTAGVLTGNNVFVSLSSVSNGTYTLANYASVAAGSNFSLSSTTGNVQTLNLGRTTETLTVGSTALTLTVGGLANPNVAYYNNAVGSGIWNDTSNANIVNFSSNKAGTTDAGQVPGSVTDVILVADNLAGTTVSSRLGSSTTINSLNVNSTATSNTITSDGSTLIINALADSNTDTGGGYTGNTAGNGIAIASGAGAVTINAGVNLGNSQSWTNNSTNLFTVGGAIAGTAVSGTQTLTLTNTGTGSTLISGAISSSSGGGAVALTVNNTGTGAGLTTTLTGANTYGGATTVTAGTLQLGDGTTGHDGTITNSASVSLASGTTLKLNPFGTTASYNGAISGAGSVTKTGAGTASLGGTSSYTGGTTVSAGTLATTDNVSAFGPSGASTAVAIGSGGTVLINSTSNFFYNDTFSGSGLLKFSFPGGGNGGNDTVVNNFSNFTGTIELAAPNGANSNNKLQIQTTYGAGGALSGATLQIDSGAQFFTANNIVFGAINVQGTGNGENRGAIRLNGNGTTSGVLGGNVFLQGNTTIGNEGGKLTGNISTAVAGTSTLTMGTSNSTGAATLSGNLTNGTGTLALTQASGTTILSGANTYTGATAVSGGTLLVNGNNNAATGAVTVNNNGSLLGGTGSLGGAVTVGGSGTAGTVGPAITAGTRGSGGTVSAANVGTLSIGALTLNSTGVFHADFLSGSSFDVVNATSVTLAGTLEVNAAAAQTFSASMILINNSGVGAINGTFNGLAEGAAVTVGGSTLYADYFGGDGNDFALTVTPVPEPGTVVAGLLALGTLGMSQRRRVRRFLTARRLPVAA